MRNQQQDPSHYEAEKRDRHLNTAFGAVLFQILAYFGYVDPAAAKYMGIFTFSLIIANNFTTPKLPIFSHFANLGASIMLYFFLNVGEIDVARLLSLINAVSIGFEQRKLFFRVLYTLVSLISWFLASKFKNSFPPTDCNHQRFEQDMGIFMLSILFLMLISSSHSDLERKALKEAEESLSKLKDLNEKYEQANKRLKLLLEEKDNFILLFSHETRNPLNILMGNLSILLTEVQLPHLRARLTRAQFCAELLLQNLNNILDTGKLINQGTLEIAPVGVNLSQYLHAIWDMAKMMVTKKQLKPMLVVPQTLPRFVKLDSQRASQIIINLISNSVKFTASGSVSLTVKYLKQREITEQDFLPSTVLGNKLFSGKNRHHEAHLNRNSQVDLNESRINIDDERPGGQRISRKSYAGELMREFKTNSQKIIELVQEVNGHGFLKLEVMDTGCGIKEDDLDKLFRRFSQVNSEASQRQIGSGLGLWISKTLAELMDGGIRVYSKPNIGTNFVVIIRADFAAMPSESVSKPRLESFNNKDELYQRILLVDDDAYNLETHIQLLKSLGSYEIETASDGWALVNAVKNKPEYYYELILTDINIPNLNGIEAVKLVRQFEKSAGRKGQIKVAFITGNSSNKERRLCESADVRASHYLTKPLTVAMLQSTLYALGLGKNRVNNKRVTAATDRGTFEINSRRKPLVLCVDDDILNLEIFEDLINDLGARPVRATSGREALKIFASRLENGPAIDLVLIDCFMPEIDGWIVSSEMKKLATHVPVIGVTGCNMKQHQEKLKMSRMNEVIRKPVQKEELGQILKKYVNILA